jgi:hypothetical protein
MARRMGRRGADLLYDMFVTSPNLRVAARERLDNPNTRKSFSPALAIAYELKTASGCEARLPLLDRAGNVGDERSLAILQTLGSRTRKGCGFRKQRPALPSLRQAIRRFQARRRQVKRLTAQAGQPSSAEARTRSAGIGFRPQALQGISRRVVAVRELIGLAQARRDRS